MQTCILNVTSGDADAKEIDAYLLGAHFMARYESFVQNYGNKADLESLKQTKVWYHFDGAAAILKLWYDNRYRYTPTSAINQTRRTLIKSCLLREQPLPPWLSDGSIFGEMGIALEFDRLIIRSIRIHHMYLKLKQALEDGGSIAPELGSLINKSRLLQQAIEDWSTRLPSKWAYGRHTLAESRNFSQDRFYSATIFTCERPSYSAVWNAYYATRLLISHTRLRILDLAATQLDGTYRQETLECLSQLNSSAESLASFIPFCLDHVRIRSDGMSKASIEISNEPFKPYLASLVVWPMSIASSLQKLDPAQRQWFRSALFHVSSASSECLLAYAMSDFWALR